MRPKQYPTDQELQNHTVVSADDWTKARIQLLQKEKELTRQQEKLSEEIRALPWVKIEKDYTFDTLEGPKHLADLFNGRSQLFVKHFMFGPEWEEGCVGCSFECDHLDGAVQHLQQHDVTVVVISRAPLEKLQAFKKRMGWNFDWVSSQNTAFNYDFHVSFKPVQMASGQVYYNYTRQPAPIDELSGFSVFYKDAAGDVYHTYSAFGRGAEYLMGTYVALDMTPKGRNENGPGYNLTDWVRHHDRYTAGGHVKSTGMATPEPATGGCNCGPKDDQP